MNDFPRMLYKAGGPHEIHGGRFDTLIVDDSDELDAALANGWHLNTDEAKAPPVAPKDDEPPTRQEMLQKATELGLTFRANIPSAKLLEMLDAALAKG